MHKDDTCMIQVLSFTFTVYKVQVFFFAIFFRISKTAASRINVNSNHSIDTRTRTHSPLVCTTIRIKLINSWQEIYSMKKGSHQHANQSWAKQSRRWKYEELIIPLWSHVQSSLPENTIIIYGGWNNVILKHMSKHFFLDKISNRCHYSHDGYTTRMYVHICMYEPQY